MNYANTGGPVYGYGAAYQGGGYAPSGRHWFRTFVFAALIALIPFVGGGASAIYVERRHDPGSFRLGEACWASFVSAMAIFAFYVGLVVLAVVAYVVLSTYL